MGKKEKDGLIDKQKSDLLVRLLNFKPDFTELREYVEEPNIFRILRSGETEIRHSNFLAWLMDVNANHKMKNAFLLPFLQKLKDDYSINELNTNLSDLKFAIDREHYFIYNGKKRYLDLLLVNKDFDSGSGLIICIENKITSKENNGQLAAYKQYINSSEFMSYKNKVFLYLTPTKEVVSDKDWIKIPYDIVLYALEQSLTTPNLCTIVQQYLNAYKSILRRDIMNIDEELQSRCKEIYDSDKEIFNLIYKNTIVKANEKLVDTILETLRMFSEQGDIEIISSTNTEFRFTTDKLNRIVPKDPIGLNVWKTQHRILYRLILSNDYNKGNVKLDLTAVLTGNQNNVDSERVITVAQENYKAFSVKCNIKRGKDYTPVFKVASINAKEIDDTFLEQVKERISKFIVSEIKIFEEKF